MAATKKSQQKLVDTLRGSGLRRSVAENIAGAVNKAGGGRKPPSAVAKVVGDLRAITTDLEDRISGGPAKRKAAAKKAAATRKRNAVKRSASAKKGAATRAKNKKR